MKIKSLHKTTKQGLYYTCYIYYTNDTIDAGFNKNTLTNNGTGASNSGIMSFRKIKRRLRRWGKIFPGAKLILESVFEGVPNKSFILKQPIKGYD